MEQRIGRREHTYTHPDAVEWLTKFMVDLKKMVLVEENYQPFTMERLNEWTKHRDEIGSCWDFESAMIRRLADNPIYEHDGAIMCFNGIVIDLKLMVMKATYEAITPERIEEADGYYLEIVRCKKHRTHFT